MSTPSPSGPPSGAKPAESKDVPISHLDTGRLPLSQLRSQYRNEMSSLLDAISQSRKALIMDRSLAGPLGLVCEPDFLRGHGVDVMYYLAAEELTSNITQLVYLTRPTITSIRAIALQIMEHRKSKKTHTYAIIFVPRKTIVCDRELEDVGIKGDIKYLCDLPLDLIPIESDLLSLELPDAYRQCYLDGDPSVLHTISRSLLRLQGLFGLIPVIKGKGNFALKLTNLLGRMRVEFAKKGMSSVNSSHTTLQSISSLLSSLQSPQPKTLALTLAPPPLPTPTVPPFQISGLYSAYSDLSELIIVDRNIDVVTPMLTQLTYEGLIDELYSIKNCTIDVDSNILSQQTTPAAPQQSAAAEPKTKKLLLTSTDTVFAETRDLPFRGLGPLLAKKLAWVNATFEERHEAMGLPVVEMHKYMLKFKTAHTERQYLSVHVNLADQIAPLTTKSKIFDRRLDIEKSILEGIDTDAVEEYIEAAIAKSEPFLNVLRLICLLSVAQGIRTKKYDTWKRDILQTYGYPHIFTLINLEKLGILSARRSQWNILKKSMRLFVTDQSYLSNGKPADIAYVYEGYAPLIVRMIEMSVRVGWKRMEEMLTAAPGHLFEVRQETSKGAHLMPLTPQSLLSVATPPTSGPSSPTTSSTNTTGTTSLDGDNEGQSKPIVLVYFIGGCTYAEISALRWLGAQESHPVQYVIATTKLINGTTFLESLQENVQNAIRDKVLRR